MIDWTVGVAGTSSTGAWGPTSSLGAAARMLSGSALHWEAATLIRSKAIMLLPIPSSLRTLSSRASQQASCRATPSALGLAQAMRPTALSMMIRLGPCTSMRMAAAPVQPRCSSQISSELQP